MPSARLYPNFKIISLQQIHNLRNINARNLCLEKGQIIKTRGFPEEFRSGKSSSLSYFGLPKYTILSDFRLYSLNVHIIWKTNIISKLNIIFKMISGICHSSSRHKYLIWRIFYNRRNARSFVHNPFRKKKSNECF